MNSDRIKEIQKGTAYPDSVSVQQALLQVWNECEQQPSEGEIDVENIFIPGIDWKSDKPILLTVEQFKKIIKELLNQKR